jgi:ABC-type lipoprotein release transport system permease subunit
MSLIIKIALRNVLRHKGKSLIIGIILFLGSLFMTLGSAIITGMEKGLHDNIVESFTGDYVIVSTNQKDESIFSIGGPGEPGAPPTEISGFTNIEKVLNNLPYVDSYIPVCRGIAMALNEKGDIGFAPFLGLDIARYMKMFHHNLEPVEGRLLSPGVRGSLVTAGERKLIYNDMDVWLTPVDSLFIESSLTPDARSNRSNLDIESNLILMGINAGGSQMDIKTPVIGIFRYKIFDSLWGGNESQAGWNILDLESFRECFAYNTAEDTVTNLTGEEKKIFGSEDSLDSLFSGGSVVTGIETGNSAVKIGNLKRVEKPLNPSNYNEDAGIYNIILLKVKKNYNPVVYLPKFNNELARMGLGVKAIDWITASGIIGNFLTAYKVILYAFVIILYFVALIIITNTMSMATLERTSEIGMMRAVGSGKNFISKMFFVETGILSFVFGGLGILTGGVLSLIFSSLRIGGGSNQMLLILFGGDYMNPIINGMDIVWCIFLLALVTLLAFIYPNIVSRKITPLEAIARD